MDPAAPQSRLLAGWQPDVQRLLSDIVPMLSAELRHTFRDFVKGLTAKRDAREIPSLSAALMEQAPQVVGADLWQQCIDRQREAAARAVFSVPQLKEKCRAAGLPVGGTKPVLIERLQAATAPAAAPAPAAPVPAAAGAPAPPPREADVIDPTGDTLDDILNLAPRCARGGKNPLRVAVALKRKAQKECDEALAETKRVQAGKGVAVLSTTTECYERINQLDRRLTKFADYCIELGADPDEVNELRYGPI